MYLSYFHVLIFQFYRSYFKVTCVNLVLLCLVYIPLSIQYTCFICINNEGVTGPHNPLFELTVYSKVRLDLSQFGCFHHNKHFSQPIPLDLTLFCSPYTTWWQNPGISFAYAWFRRVDQLENFKGVQYCSHQDVTIITRPKESSHITNKRYSELLLLPYRCS